MGKFKEIAIDIEDAQELLKKHHVKCKNCDVLADEVIHLNKDLQTAITFGVQAETEIERLQEIVGDMLKDLLKNEIVTIANLEKTYGITMIKMPKSHKLN